MFTHIHTYSYSLLTPQHYVRLFCQRVALAVPLASAGIFNVSVLTSLWWLASWDWWPPSVGPVTPVTLGLVTPVPSIEVGAASTGGFFSSTSADSEPGTRGEGRQGTGKTWSCYLSMGLRCEFKGRVSRESKWCMVHGARSCPILPDKDLTRSMLMLALKAARLNWSLQSTLCFIACTALLCSMQYFHKCSLWERGSSCWVFVRFHELKNVLTVNNVPPHGGSLPLDPFLQSSVEFELIRTFRKDFAEIFDTEREREGER